MATFMTIFVVSIMGLYCCWLIIMIIGWSRIEVLSPIEDLVPTVAIIIPFRNESLHLPQLIESLKSLHYNNHQLEILLVNDHSDDDYQGALSHLGRNMKLLHLPEQKLGKKEAISFGVKNTDAEIIITSDADCLLNPGWIESLIPAFKNNDIKLVFGGVALYYTNSFFERLQAVEFAPVIGVGAASAEIGYPFMCNGANLAFRKSAFLEVGGYKGNEHIATGDDEFLLSKIRGKYPNGIQYCKNRASVVYTRASHSFSEFFYQRKRWASKWSANRYLYKIIVALLVAITSIVTFLAFVLLFTQPDALLLIGIILKVVLEAIFIKQIVSSMDKTFDFLPFLIIQIIYPLYGVVMAISANIGKYKWKGRVH